MRIFEVARQGFGVPVLHVEHVTARFAREEIAGKKGRQIGVVVAPVDDFVDEALFESVVEPLALAEFVEKEDGDGEEGLEEFPLRFHGVWPVSGVGGIRGAGFAGKCRKIDITAGDAEFEGQVSYAGAEHVGFARAGVSFEDVSCHALVKLPNFLDIGVEGLGIVEGTGDEIVERTVLVSGTRAALKSSMRRRALVPAHGRTRRYPWASCSSRCLRPPQTGHPRTASSSTRASMYARPFWLTAV